MEGFTLKKRLTGHWLKLLALDTMVIDHVAAGFIPYRNPWWYPMRAIGRLAFPIYAFLIAEGAERSRNVWRYLLRLLIFAFLSEIPYDMFFHRTWLEFGNQNILFTLSTGLLGIIIYKKAREKGENTPWPLLGLAGAIVCGAAAHYLNFDYGWKGIALIFAMYHWRTVFKDSLYYPFLLALLMALMWQQPRIQLFALLAIIPLSFYNGERGSSVNKYLFYIFYPLHILILLHVRMAMAGGAG